MCLAKASGQELLSEQIGTFDLPVTDSEWHKRFSQFVDVEARVMKYLEADCARFFVRGDELGEYTLELERTVKPIRWICRSVNRNTAVRLVDDTGRDDAATCRFFNFRRPAQPISLDLEAVLTGFQIPQPGGVFEAVHGNFMDTLLVSSLQIEGGLQGLVIEPDLHEIEDDAVSVIHILELIHLWSEARALGPLIGMRRRRIVGRLNNRFYSRLCGRRWAAAEDAYFANPQSESGLRQLERLVGGAPGFSVLLKRDYEKMGDSNDLGKQWYANAAARYQVCSEKGLCEFALQLASAPQLLLRLPRPVLDELLLAIKENTVLLRGARLLALMTASNAEAGGTAPRWQ